MRFHYPQRLAPWLLGLNMLAFASSALSQTSTLLSLQSLHVTTEGPVAFTFRDEGTGATNYLTLYSPAVGANADWQVNAQAVLTAQGGGLYQVSIQNPPPPPAFYRIVALGSADGPIRIEFSTTALQGSEGDSLFPTLLLSQPFRGTVFYTVGGTAASGDYTALTGQVQVDGTSATIPVLLNDDDILGRLRSLTLRLEAGPGYQLAGNSQTSVTIEDNDAFWEGTFVSGNAAIAFRLQVTQRADGAAQGILAGDPFGFFPTNAVPVALTLAQDIFLASAASIPMPAAATLLALPIVQRLDLSAANGQLGQEVGPDRIEGVGTLITTVPDAPHLHATNRGSFVLIKPPALPGTNEVQLVNAP